MRLQSRSWLGTRKNYCARWVFFFLATSCRMCNHTLSYITCSPEARAPRGGCRHSPSPAHHSSVYCLGFSRGSCPHGLKVVVSCITWSHTPFGWRYWHQGVFVSFDTVTNGHKFCGLKQQKCIIPQLWRSEGKIDLSGQNKHVGRAAFFGVAGEPVSSPFPASGDFLPVVQQLQSRSDSDLCVIITLPPLTLILLLLFFLFFLRIGGFFLFFYICCVRS